MSRQKKPGINRKQEMSYWRGEVNKLRKLLDSIIQQMDELERSFENRTTKVEKKEKSFREKFRDEHYPK